MIRSEEQPIGTAERAAVLLSTCPPGEAERLAAFLVEKHHAACVNIVPGVTSVYRWEGKLQRDTEALLVIKVRADRIEHVTRALVEEHPYDVPEVIALPLRGGHEPYLAWVLENAMGA